MNLPEPFLMNMKSLLKEDFEKYIQCLEDKRVYGLRVNTLKISVEDFLKISPFELEPIPWCSNGFYYKEEDRPAKHPYYYAGLYYLQEPSAMVPAHILPVEEDDFILDMCAAPGGKSTELASKLKGTGVLISNDISASRAQALLRNLEKAGCINSYVISEDLSKFDDLFFETFDKILIDAPCSGEGMFRKDANLIKSWNENSNDQYASIQKGIVDSAIKMLKPGGYLVYSTCTFSKKEDEDIIEYMLESNPSLSVVPVENRYERFSKGFSKHTKDSIRIFPYEVQGEGHFVTLLKKDGSLHKNNIKYTSSGLQDKNAQEFLKHIKRKWKNGSFKLMKDKLYFVPFFPLDLKGIRILRSGLFVGTIKKNSFEPSQALALSLKMDEFDTIINLKCKDVRVHKYLRGETLDIMDYRQISGWVLVCVDGYPIGFGKANKGSLKNKIEKGWIMR
ncbi:MAG: RsmF rRNA methyltransferase first C-terminal domain-containing protein [Holdemanella sp.]|nr:RsmF rRNA methyltransferase first C-terminal domain-containing protein [Holdemanella sp.]